MHGAFRRDERTVPGISNGQLTMSQGDWQQTTVAGIFSSGTLQPDLHKHFLTIFEPDQSVNKFLLWEMFLKFQINPWLAKGRFIHFSLLIFFEPYQLK